MSIRVHESGLEEGPVLLFSPGFAAALKDYGPIVRILEKRFRVVRILHRGSSRASGLVALARLFWARWALGQRPEEAAKWVRRWIHSPSKRAQRFEQIHLATRFYEDSFPDTKLSLAGHSYGTDTVLQVALQNEVEELFLFSPHPPGYLIKERDYEATKAKKIWLVTGTKDRTRDGVGPEQRLRVSEFLKPEVLARTINLPGVGHMDFAFDGWGPEGWEAELATQLREVLGSH